MAKRRRRQKEAIPTEAEAPDLKLVAQFVVPVPVELALRLRGFCQETRQSFNQTVAEALEQYLKRKKPPGKKPPGRSRV